MSWVAKKNNVQANFINLSNKTNLYISNWVSDKIVNIIKNKKIKKILLLGMAYKKDVNDSRESPSIKIFNKLNKLKLTKLDYQDKFISSVKLNNVSKKTVLNVSYKKYDCIVLLTDHSYYNYNKIYKDSKLIIDTRGVFRLKKNKVIHL
jgi:UDP-N-acetyl-D-glucosamine dehydrogenase